LRSSEKEIYIGKRKYDGKNRCINCGHEFNDLEFKEARKKRRDIICASLRATGLNVQIAERGLPEENIPYGQGTSLGLKTALCRK